VLRAGKADGTLRSVVDARTAGAGVGVVDVDVEGGVEEATTAATGFVVGRVAHVREGATTAGRGRLRLTRPVRPCG